MRRIPSFPLLRAFEAAARLESFSLASAELHLTPSAISHQIKELEEHLSCTLFIRSHRRVEVTEQGRKLAHSLSGIFDTIEAACNEVSVRPDAGLLSIHSAPSFAANWLSPRLKDFARANAEINVQISSTAEPIDLMKDRTPDVCISYGQVIRKPGLTVWPLGTEEIAPMCAPDFLHAHEDFYDLLHRGPLIESPYSRVKWEEWFSINAMVTPKVRRLTFDRASLGISAAADGMGIVLESVRLAEAELASGALVTCAADDFPVLHRETHYLSVRSSEQDMRKIKAFSEWLLALSAGHEAPAG